jgi:hypothetical protein
MQLTLLGGIFRGGSLHASTAGRGNRHRRVSAEDLKQTRFQDPAEDADE